jgi:hypothetical protein
MRRLPAVLLVVLFSFSLFPVLSNSSGDDTLPACCRRGGQHSCSMTTGKSESSGVAFRVGRCPLFPTIKAAPGSGTSFLPRLSFSAFLSQPRCNGVQPTTLSLCRVTFDRSDSKRGSPAILA